MNENLRGRIAKVIHETETPLRDHGQALAQAIIDELGLWESSQTLITGQTATRILGKLEVHDE